MKSTTSKYTSTTLLFSQLWSHIHTKRRWQLAGLLVLMVVSSFSEILSIGSVLPFLGLIAAPERIMSYQPLQPLLKFLGINSAQEFLVPLAIIFGLFAMLAGALRLLLIWASLRISFATGSDLSIEIYRRTLYQPYITHVQRNSSEIIDGISIKANEVIHNLLLPFLSLISATLMLMMVMGTLFFINSVVALSVLGAFGMVYFFISLFTKERVALNGRHISRESSLVIRSLQEGLGGIRDVLISGTQEVYCQLYAVSNRLLRQAQSNNLFIAQAPRFIMEALGMLLIAILVCIMSDESKNILGAIPILGVLALAAQRLLPILQQAYSSWVNIHGGKTSLYEVMALLNQPLPSLSLEDSGGAGLAFNKSIELKNIFFRYGDTLPWTLNDFNLVIPKGGRIGIVGASGSGKSTLIDVVMTLLWPSHGCIEVDGLKLTPENVRAWQKRIAHVPQSIFLSDASVEENIAFGVESNRIDRDLVRKCAEQAQIAQVIDLLPSKYQTSVGERGVRLSGGQRQRIGIARALYQGADLIIFDEATSALDSETEEAVMQSIEALDEKLTILIVAHRLTTLKNCSQIIDL